MVIRTKKEKEEIKKKVRLFLDQYGLKTHYKNQKPKIKFKKPKVKTKKK